MNHANTGKSMFGEYPKCQLQIRRSSTCKRKEERGNAGPAKFSIASTLVWRIKAKRRVKSRDC